MRPYKSQEIVKFLLAKGWILDHMTGSHAIMYHPDTKKRTTIPVHRKELATGTLMAILKQTGISKEDLLDF